LSRAHAAMPHITRLVFMKCSDLKPERLQEAVDNRLSPFIEVLSLSLGLAPVCCMFVTS
jgi:hypothetical protein